MSEPVPGPATGSRTHRLRVVEVITETADAHSLVLKAPRESVGRFAYRPGQFLTLKLPGAGGRAAARCYSLASSPHTGEPLKVTVKRVAGGYGSNWVCDQMAAGDELEVLPPASTFTPSDLDADLLLVAGGRLRRSGTAPPAAGECAPAEGGSTAEVELDGETHTVAWPSGSPLLDVLLAAGVEAPYSCREGACSACTCRVVTGEVKLLRNEVLDDQDIAEGYVLACQAVPLTEQVEITYS